MWDRFKQAFWQWRGIWAIAPSATIAVLLIRATGLLQTPELSGLDLLFRLRPTQPRDDRIIVVGISEQDLQRYGHPINDRLLADTLETIAAGNPSVICLDIYRDLPVPPSYDSLVDTFRQQPQLLEQENPREPSYERLTAIYRDTEQLVGIAKVTGGVERVDPPPVLAELHRSAQENGGLPRIAANDLPRDQDGKLRRGFFYLNDPETGDTVFSVGFTLAQYYLARQGIQPDLTPDANQWVMFGSTVFPPLSSSDGGYVRIDNKGYQILINYRGQGNSFETIELRDLLEGRVSPERFRDRVVLIGYTAESLKDFFDTPFSARGSGIEQTAGVEVHANITSHILGAVLDGRSQIRPASHVFGWSWIFLAAVLGASVSWAWRYNHHLWRVLGQIALGTVCLGAAYAAFLEGWWIPLLPPLLAQSLAAVGVTAYVARSAADIRQAFSRYLTDEVVATLLETPEGLTMGGERRKITILTSDLRGFTSISERLPPEQVVGILNIYLEAMADAITAYQGTIDEFMGDGILVLFGAPTQREDDAERAIACAIAMQRAMSGVNAQMSARNLPNLEMGIGINTGEVVVGNIGSLKRTKYGVVGSQVNLTYRIESYTVGGQILVTEQTTAEVGDLPLDLESEEKVSPKGVVQPITVYSIVGIGGKYNLHLSRDEAELRTLPQPVGLDFCPLDGKHLSDRNLRGRLVKLSPQRAYIQSDTVLPPLTNLRFQLDLPDVGDPASREFYAKVVHDDDLETWMASAGDRAFCVRVTAVPAEVQADFDRLYASAETPAAPVAPSASPTPTPPATPANPPG